MLFIASFSYIVMPPLPWSVSYRLSDDATFEASAATADVSSRAVTSFFTGLLVPSRQPVAAASHPLFHKAA